MEQENEHFDLRYSSLSHHSCLSVEDFQIISVISFPNIFQQNKFAPFAPLLFYKRGVLGTTRVNRSPVSLGLSSTGLLNWPPESLSRRIQGFLVEIKALIFLQNKWNGTRNIRTASGKATSGGKRGLQPGERLSLQGSHFQSLMGM